MRALLRHLALVTLTLVAAPLTARAGEGGEEKKAEAAPPVSKMQASDHYVSSWLPMPGFTATQLPSAESGKVEAKPGRMLVVLFLASWCEPCQQLITAYQQLEHRYHRLNVDFVYMFAFDTKDDAQGFMQEFHLPTGYLANHDVLKAYHNPELPTVYIGDRHGWLANRWANIHADDLAKIDEFLRDQAAY